MTQDSRTARLGRGRPSESCRRMWLRTLWEPCCLVMFFLASALWPGPSAHRRRGWFGLQSGPQSRTGEEPVFRGGGPKTRSPLERCGTSGFERLHLEGEEKLSGNRRALAGFPGEQQVPANWSSGSREFVGRNEARSKQTSRPRFSWLSSALK